MLYVDILNETERDYGSLTHFSFHGKKLLPKKKIWVLGVCVCVRAGVLGALLARTTKYEPLRVGSEAAPALKKQHKICGCCGKWVELSGGVQDVGITWGLCEIVGKRREVV